MYVRNDAKSDCLDSRYNLYFIVLDAIPPNVTIDTGVGRTRNVHLNRCKIHPFQGGSTTPLAVNDFTGSHLANGPLIESESTDIHGFSDEFETRDRRSPQPIASQQETWTTRTGRIV